MHYILGLLTILKLIAPIMPFISEEIYQTHFKNNEKDKSIHISKWPESDKGKAFDEFDLLTEIIGKVRQEKSVAKKSMKAEIILTISKEEKNKIKDLLEDLKDVTNAREIKEGNFKVEFI